MPAKPTGQGALRNLLTETQAAAFLGVKPQTLSVWRLTNRYPLKYVRIGGKFIRYRPADLESFAESHLVEAGDE